MPEHLPSRFPTTVLPSTNFLESCGCILFDFRHTNIDPLNPSFQSQSQNPSAPTLSAENEPHIILIHSHSRSEYLLSKGRRNISESRANAALRETTEETGLKVSLLPVTLHSRATSADPSLDRTDIDGFTLDEVRVFGRVAEPFTLVLRQVQTGNKGDGVEEDATGRSMPRGSQREGSGDVMKLIWWFVGVVDGSQGSDEEVRRRREGVDPGCEVVAVPMWEAAGRCSFRDDAKIVQEAIEVVRRTFKWQ